MIAGPDCDGGQLSSCWTKCCVKSGVKAVSQHKKLMLLARACWVGCHSIFQVSLRRSGSESAGERNVKPTVRSLHSECLQTYSKAPVVGHKKQGGECARSRREERVKHGAAAKNWNNAVTGRAFVG